MSTVQPAGGAFDLTGARKVPFSRLVEVEMRKMVDTRAGLWLMGIIVVASTLSIIGIWWVSRSGGGASFVDYLSITLTPQMLLMPVLGILLVTGEWGQRTTLNTFALEPSRLRIMAAKVAAAIVYTLLAFVLIAAIAAVFALLSDDGFADLSTQFVVNAFIIQVLGVLMGLAFGTLILNTAGAIIAYFALPMVLSLVFMLIPKIGDKSVWIDLASAQLPLFNDIWPTAQEWAQIATASGIWIVLPLVLGLVRVTRMELK